MPTISLRVLKNQSEDEKNPGAISEEEVPSRMLPKPNRASGQK